MINSLQCRHADRRLRDLGLPDRRGALVSTVVGLSAVRIDGDELYWLESHPEQGGRTGLWRQPLGGGQPVEVTPEPAYVRSRVCEYGGGEYAVRDGLVVYTELADGRVYRVTDGRPEPITPAGPFRFGDLRLHPDRGLVLAVREDSSGDGEPAHALVRLDLTGPNADGGTVLCTGADFYATPELSATGRFAWTEWNHPDMPWDASTVMVGTLGLDGVTGVKAVAGGPGESACSRAGWATSWSCSRTGPVGGTSTAPTVTSSSLHQEDAEFGGPRGRSASPSTRSWTTTTSSAWSTGTASSRWRSSRCRPASWPRSPIAASPTRPVAGAGCGRGGPDLPRPGPAPSACSMSVRRPGRPCVARPRPTLPPEAVSVAEPVTWTSPEGPVHGWLYPPTNPVYRAPADRRPPLLVTCHGGPTGFAPGAFVLAHQFWTSRGYAILDVNYGGSAGFGRAYRERLRGRWGIVDARDCIDGAQAMVEQGRADPERLVIRGGSAGGYTALRALTSSEIFAAGISLYGVSDLEALAKDTHKFESRYLDGLVGPYPEDRETYLDRSPINTPTAWRRRSCCCRALRTASSRPSRPRRWPRPRGPRGSRWR